MAIPFLNTSSFSANITVATTGFFGGKVNIQGTPPVTPNANFDDLVITDSGNTGISIFSGNTSDGAIYFGDTNANNLGQIKYLHSTNSMTFATNAGNPTLILDSGLNSTFAGELYSAGKVGIGTTDPNSDGYSFAEDLVIKGGNSASDGVGITLASNGKRYGVIAFGDTADNNVGEIFYDHTINAMHFRTNGAGNVVAINSVGKVTAGSATVAGDTALTLTTKGYVDALTPGAGVFLPLAGGTMNSDATINMNSGQLTSVDFVDFGIGQLNGESSSNLILKSLGDITYNVDSNNNGNSSHIFQESGSELMRIRYDGKVGIKDTDPKTTLQISTDSLTNKIATVIGDGFISNDAYHKEGGFLLISGTSQGGTQTGAGIAFQTRNNTNTNYWKSSVIMDRDGAVRFTLGGQGTAAGSEDFTILSNGNVGIGNTNPIGCLDIDDTFKVEGNLRLGDSTIYGGGWARGMITLYQNTSTGSKNFVRQGMLGSGDAVEYWWHSMDTTTTSPWSNNAFRIYPNNNVIVGLQNGKVGIDTTLPLAKLQVGLSTSNNGERSTLAMFGAAASGVLNALSLVNTTGAAATGNGTRINFHLSSNYSPTGCIEVVTTDLSVSATDSTMRFKTYGTIGSSVTYVPRLEISPFGAIKFNDYNLAKQTGTPTYILGTDGSGNVVKVLGADIPGTPGGSGTLRTIPMWTPDGDTLGDSNVKQDSTGNIGIGTGTIISPPQDLGLTIQSTTTTSRLILKNSSTGVGANDGFRIGAVGTNVEFEAKDSGDFQFFTVGTQVLTIKSSGHVGIGTTGPIEKLQVEGKVYIQGNGQNWNETTPGLTRGSVHFDPGTNVANTGNALTFGASDSPGAPNEGSNAQAGIYTRTDGSYGTKMYFATTDSYASGSKTRMMIDYNGNVGIGTTGPTYKLDVVGNGRFSGFLEMATGGAVYQGQKFYLDGGGDTFLESPSSNIMTFTTNAVEKMRITSAGTVLINATSPRGTYATGSPIKLSVISGMSEFETTLTNNDDWENSPITILERGNAGASQTADKYAPNLNFHWSARVSNSLWLGANGNLNYGGYSPAGIPATDGTFAAGNLIAASNITGNTGTFTGKATSASTVSADAATTLVTKDYVDSSAGNPSHFRQGHKNHNLTNAFTTCLTVNLDSHTGCYVTICVFGDWGSHSSAAYRGEFFLQNGANAYNEPGIILRQDDNTSVGTDQIICQIVDPTSTANPKDFNIQIRTTATSGTTGFTGLLTFTVQGKFNSVT